jgi:predicted acylesterase/phospholipase RssA
MKIIKHLVLCGGGPIGLLEYGALKHLTTNNIIDISNIESIYSSSVGSIIGFIYVLNFDWLWIYDFLIKRPWEKLVNFSYGAYLNVFYDKGIVNKKVIINALKPLFLAKEIPLTITLLEFYNLTAIEFNIYTCNLTSFKKEKLNYINTPNLELIDALYMSISIPVLFVPLYINNCYYLDGSIFINCPINECILDKKCCYDEILCFTNDKRQPIDLCNNFYNENNYCYNSGGYQLNEEANFFEYLIYIIKTLFNKVSIIENENLITIKNSINVCLSEQTIDFKYWSYAFKTEIERDYLVKLGEKQGEKFISMLLSLKEETIKEETIKEETIKEETIKEDIIKEETIKEDTIKEDTIKEDTTILK